MKKAIRELLVRMFNNNEFEKLEAFAITEDEAFRIEQDRLRCQKLVNGEIPLSHFILSVESIEVFRRLLFNLIK